MSRNLFSCWRVSTCLALYLLSLGCSTTTDKQRGSVHNLEEPPIATRTSAAHQPQAETAGDKPHEPTVNPWMDSARVVLIQHCGKCHQPGHPTSSQKALAIFNLNEKVWYSRMTKDQFAGLRRRILGTKAATDSDKRLVELCIASALDDKM